MSWTVVMKRRQLRKLGRLPTEVQVLFQALVKDLESSGPLQPSWRNFSKLSRDSYHCHLNYGYVACWWNRGETLIIEVTYVGSRENAPY